MQNVNPTIVAHARILMASLAKRRDRLVRLQRYNYSTMRQDLIDHLGEEFRDVKAIALRYGHEANNEVVEDRYQEFVDALQAAQL